MLVAGRRLRNAVKKVLVDGGAIPADSHVVLSGLSNTYADYFTTYEEYQVQRYEAASTIFGPHSLSGLIQEFSKLADAIARNSTVPHGPTPPDFTGRQLSFVLKPREDVVPDGYKFGSIITGNKTEEKKNK
jgi:neutral ceramidase